MKDSFAILMTAENQRLMQLTLIPYLNEQLDNRSLDGSAINNYYGIDTYRKPCNSISRHGHDRIISIEEFITEFNIKIPFDEQLYDTGKYDVVTRDGRNIIRIEENPSGMECSDLCAYHNRTEYILVSRKGKYYSEEDNKNDLFLKLKPMEQKQDIINYEENQIVIRILEHFKLNYWNDAISVLQAAKYILKMEKTFTPTEEQLFPRGTEVEVSNDNQYWVRAKYHITMDQFTARHYVKINNRIKSWLFLREINPLIGQTITIEHEGETLIVEVKEKVG